LKTWQVLKLWGIPFYIHPNWALLLFLFSWSISNQVNLTSNEIYNIKESWLIGFFSAFLLLITIVFNQIPHTFVSLKEGVKIKNITFFFLGAILQTDKECQNAAGNIKISIVRPLFYFFTSICLFFISYSSDAKDQIIIDIISRVAILNLFLGFFNLIPFSTLDGANLLKSIIWHYSGNKNKGRHFLNRVTLLLSFLLLILGAFCIFITSFYYGILISLIGLFGINSSKSESQFLKIERILKHTKVSELTLIPLRRLEYDLSLQDFNKIYQNKKDKSVNYYFITNNGRWDGFFTGDSLKEVSFRKWANTLVGEYKKPIKDFPNEFNDTPLWKLISRLEKTSQGILLIVNSLGIPQGLIDRNRIGYFILDQIGFNLSAELRNKLKIKNKYPLGLELQKIIELMKKNGDLQ
tara:strand:+ start:58033 stop:59259 length:1227 start_codon:yes stop_codon:yes gene_type:complete